MEQADIEMINDIMDSEAVGYACFYPKDKSEVKDFLISTTSENIACFIRNWIEQADKIVIIDIVERMIMTINGEGIESSNKKLIDEVQNSLRTKASGEKQRDILLAIPRKISDQYFFEEDQTVTMMEIGVLQG